VSAERITISSSDYWFRETRPGRCIWALVDAFDGEDVTVYLISEDSRILSSEELASREEARRILAEGGFRRLLEDSSAQVRFEPPAPPFHRQPPQ
jgi:hypothetical protein